MRLGSTVTLRLPSCSVRKCCSALGWIPVILVWALILWSFYVYVYIVCWKSYLAEHKTIAGSLLLVLYLVLFSLFTISYVRVVATDPGRPIKLAGAAGDPEPDEEDTRSAMDFDALARTEERGAKGFVEEAGMNEPTDFSVTLGMGGESSDVLLSMPTEPDGGAETISYVAHETKNSGKARYCKKCAVHKPDRTHHCSICDRCILKMDHHCPWLNSCVGYQNYKFFYLFVVWGTVYCIFICGSTVPSIVDFFAPGQQGLGADVLQKALLVLTSGLFGLALAMFSVMHTTLLLGNKTTIESFQERTLIRFEGKGPLLSVESSHIYDLGSWRENFRQVMGRNPWLQWLPVSTQTGNGHSFPIGRKAYNQIMAVLSSTPNAG